MARIARRTSAGSVLLATEKFTMDKAEFFLAIEQRENERLNVRVRYMEERVKYVERRFDEEQGNYECYREAYHENIIYWNRVAIARRKSAQRWKKVAKAWRRIAKQHFLTWRMIRGRQRATNLIEEARRSWELRCVK